MEIKLNQNLKNYNTFGINASADKLILINSKEEILELIKSGKLKDSKVLILGEGSNLLFQKDFKGVILKSEIKGIHEIGRTESEITLEVGSGVIWDDLVKYCVDKEYYGIENLTLIPGTVGAAPIQNIGAYGVEFEQVFDELEGINLTDSQILKFNKDQSKFGYRESIFKREMLNTFFITQVRIKLSLKPRINIQYRAIEDYIKKNNINPESIEIMKLREIIKEIRMSKLPDPKSLGNAGSFFKNPIVDKESYLSLKKHHVDLVYFKITDDQYKIPAGWLIEKIGFKGKRFNNVGVHNKQALVLVNYGNASGQEITDLANTIKAKVLSKFNIPLEMEVNIIK